MAIGISAGEDEDDDDDDLEVIDRFGEALARTRPNGTSAPKNESDSIGKQIGQTERERPFCIRSFVAGVQSSQSVSLNERAT